MVMSIQRSALFGVADAALAETLRRESERYAGVDSVLVTPDFAERYLSTALFDGV